MSGTIQDVIQVLGSNNLRNSFQFVEREIGLQLIYYMFFGNKEKRWIRKSQEILFSNAD